jgi:DNA polymerase-3 subunit alpha
MCSNNKDFTHLHCHTHFSVQDALPTPEKLILGAKAQGFTSIAITDHGKMAGHVEFADAAHRHQIKPILGCEFYLAKDRYDKNPLAEDGTKKGREKLSHLTILAQNRQGYKNILQLGHEASNPDCYYYFPRIDFDYLTKHSEGLIVLSGCLASELQQALLKGTYEDGLRVAKKYKEVFNDRYFIELQYHGIEEQKHNLPMLMKIAKELDIRTVASNDVHYVEPQDWELHDVLIQMKDLRNDKGTKNTGKKEAYGSHQFWLKSYDEMYQIFGGRVPEALSNTKLIEEMVEDYYQVDLPHMLPEGKIDHDNASFKSFWHTKLPHHESKEAYLAYQCFVGLKKLGLEKDPEYIKRLKYEIETIWYMGVTDYFLIQKEMVDYMTEKDILFGVRGSGVGSLVNYCLGISSADPIKFGLMFERFLNPGRGNQYAIDLEGFESPNEGIDEIEATNWLRLTCKEFLAKPENSQYESRISRELWILENQKMVVALKAAVESNHKLKNNSSNFVLFYVIGLTDVIPTGDLIIKKVSGLPDIDTDIDDSRRQEVIEWAKQRFGEENVKAVGTWGTYKAKAAVQGTLKTSEKFKKQFNDNLAQMAMKVSGTIPNKPGITIEEAKKESEDFAYWANRFKKEIDNATKLNGTISNLGVHAAAIVVSREPIHHVVPIENSKGTMCTAFDMSNVERTGTVKYDYLGLATYRQISLARKLIKQRHNKDINLLQIPLDDPRVFKNVFSKGLTSTVFQFASPGMQKALKEIKASTMNDLIAVAALYRPGPMDYIPDYAKGKLNPGAIKYCHPLVEKHLSPTFGIMVYQEQAMFLAREMANLDWLEVDKLRKGIAKKSGKQFDEACEIFARKASQRGVSNEVINEVLQLMSKFGGYAFNKSHACMYAIVAYWTAYLKTYYAAEWMAACIEADKDDTDKLDIYIRECERLDVKIKEPNVNESDLTTTVSEDGLIYLPITSLKGVGNSGSSIVENRPYKSLDDFVDRSGCNKSLFVALSAGGAMKCLVDDPEADEEYFLDYWLEYSKSKSKNKKPNASIIVNTNSMSLLEIRNLSQKSESSGSDLLSLLDNF